MLKSSVIKCFKTGDTTTIKNLSNRAYICGGVEIAYVQIVVVDRKMINIDMIVVDVEHDPLFKIDELILAHRVRFGYDGNNVDFPIQCLHCVQVDRFQRVTSRTYEVETDVYGGVVDLLKVALQAELLLHAQLVLSVYVAQYGLVAVLLVDLIAKT